MSDRLPIYAAFLLLLAILAGFLVAPYDPVAQDRTGLAQPPGWRHWMGTDEYGRDQLSRFLAGGSWSLLTGLAATTITLSTAWLLGCFAGYRKGIADRLIMAATELFLCIPWLYVLIGLRAALPLHLHPRTAVAIMLLLIALISWARPARLIRGIVLSLGEREFVAAARGFGIPELVIFRRHILPGTTAVLLAQGLVLFPRFVLAEVTLSYLGLGVGEPQPSWGAMLFGLKQAYLLHQEWWRILPPLLMLPVFVTFAWAAQVAAKRHDAAR